MMLIIQNLKTKMGLNLIDFELKFRLELFLADSSSIFWANTAGQNGYPGNDDISISLEFHCAPGQLHCVRSLVEHEVNQVFVAASNKGFIRKSFCSSKRELYRKERIGGCTRWDKGPRRRKIHTCQESRPKTIDDELLFQQRNYNSYCSTTTGLQLHCNFVNADSKTIS